MKEHHARGRFVDVLAAMPSGFHKRLLDIRFADSQSGHSLPHLPFFFRGDRKCAHRSIVPNRRNELNSERLSLIFMTSSPG